MADSHVLMPAVAFAMVLARVGAVVMTAPLFSLRGIPVQLRVLLALTLSLIIAPMQWPQSDTSLDVTNLLPALAGELLIGLTLGVGVMILLSGVQLAGQVISQMSGLSAEDLFGVGDEAGAPVLSQLLYMLTLAVFVALGGHRLLVGALLDTYAVMPVGRAEFPTALGDLVIALLTESFALGIRCAAPAMIALLLATLCLGMISRTLPQLNILAIGFGLNALVTYAVMAISVGIIAWLFQEHLEPALQTIVESLRATTRG